MAGSPEIKEGRSLPYVHLDILDTVTDDGASSDIRETFNFEDK